MRVDINIPVEIKASRRVLIVEDNILNQKLVAFMIKGWGLTYRTCNNGKEAIQALQEDKFDLVLMDIEMPEMNGYEATSYIRNVLKLDIPVIATTAHESAEEREKCQLSGMNDYLQKPIKESELLQTIAAYLFPLHNKKFAD